MCDYVKEICVYWFIWIVYMTTGFQDTGKCGGTFGMVPRNRQLMTGYMAFNPMENAVVMTYKDANRKVMSSKLNFILPGVSETETANVRDR